MALLSLLSYWHFLSLGLERWFLMNRAVTQIDILNGHVIDCVENRWLPLRRIVSLEIHDFRGIPHLRIDELGRINILVGRNRTCKSSILEDVTLSASAPSFQDALGIDVLS